LRTKSQQAVLGALPWRDRRRHHDRAIKMIKTQGGVFGSVSYPAAFIEAIA